MKPIYAAGVGLWAPGYPNAEAWARRAADPAATAPAAALFPAGIKRRASLLTRAGAEAFAQALAAAGAEKGKIPSVWASAYGEIVTTIEMLEQMASEPEGLPSPTRFHNSVHNTSAGYVSIASADRSFSTSLAGGPRSVAVGMLEAWALLEERGGEVVLVALDEPPPAPFAPETPYPPLAVAFHLSAEPRPGARARLTGLRQGTAAARAPEPFSTHPCAAALLLADALAAGTPGPVPLSLTGEGDWLVEVEPL